MIRSGAPQDQSPNDRATTFQAVQGEGEHYSGEALLVGAYSAIWAIVLFWVALLWRKQSAMGARLDDLEHVLNKAAADRGKNAPQ